MKEQRKLAAIMFTDIVGYTALMSKDEQKALQVLQKNRDVLKPLIKQFNGEWLKEMGDGTLSSFNSAVEAVNCALEIQRTLKDDPGFKLRIGIHVGDVIFSGGDVFGDGVNVASRIEPLAETGGICVSERVYEDLQNKPDITAVLLGEKRLKNVGHPVKVYALTGEGIPAPAPPLLGPAPLRSAPTVESRDTEQVEQTRTAVLNRRILLAAAALVVIIAGYAGFSRFGGTAGPGEIKSIAILPFEFIGNDEKVEYLIDGIPETVTSHLQKISSVNVKSYNSIRQRYKDEIPDVTVIGQEMGVNYALTGIITIQGDNLSINVELVQTNNINVIFAQPYIIKIADITEIPVTIAQDITNELSLNFTGDEEQHAFTRETENSDAFNFYHEGRKEWNKRTEESIRKGLANFEQAVMLDNNYARAYSGISDSWLLLYRYSYEKSEFAVSKAKEAAIKAIGINEALGEAHNSLAFLKRYYEWDWKGAEEEFKKALKYNPKYPTAHHWYALYLAGLGRFAEAISEIEVARNLDPYSAIINTNTAWVYYFDGQYDKAIDQFTKTLKDNPDYQVAQRRLGLAYIEKRMYSEAINEFKNVVSLSDSSTIMLSALGYGYAVNGERNEAIKILNYLIDISDNSIVSLYDIAAIYAGLGDKNNAFEWLEKALDERSSLLGYIKVDPRLENLRSDQAFSDILKKMGLDK